MLSTHPEAEQIATIEGFAYRDATGVIVKNQGKLLDFDRLPMPAWDMIDFKEYEVDLSNFYNPKGHNLTNIVSIFSERGCPFKCNFCDLYLMQGRKVRRRRSEVFVNHLEYLTKEKGLQYFSFMDDNFLVDNRHVISICNEIVRRRLDLQFQIAGGYVNAYNDVLIDALVSAGMVSTILNIEHGSQYIRRDVIGKPIEKEKIFEIVESIRRYKVNLGTNWIMGFPEDTNETLQETLDLINNIKPDRANIGTLIPYPGTPVYDQCVRDDLFVEKFNPTNYWRTPFRPHQDKPVIKPYTMSLEDLVRWRETFHDIRYKYFGHTCKDFKVPLGYVRCPDGFVWRQVT